jgi:hypothetical protein
MTLLPLKRGLVSRMSRAPIWTFGTTRIHQAASQRTTCAVKEEEEEKVAQQGYKRLAADERRASFGNITHTMITRQRP